jgi:2-polyprenyl-3-methyl-5-hydroxy-6-metoxy-1,4-benzoquinol methylase
MYAWQLRDGALTEWLDGTSIGEGALRRNLRDIRRINALLGWTAAATRAVAAITQTEPCRAWTLLDVASGSADIPSAIARWARRSGTPLTVTASDINPQIVTIARQEARSLPNLHIVQADALALPYPSQSMDIVMCTLALHHFAPEAAVALLRGMARVGRRVLLFDVERSRLAHAGVIALTHLLGMDAMTCHDAPISVRRAYSAAELRALARQAGLLATVRVQFPFRLMLTAPGHDEEPAHAL